MKQYLDYVDRVIRGLGVDKEIMDLHIRMQRELKEMVRKVDDSANKAWTVEEILAREG